MEKNKSVGIEGESVNSDLPAAKKHRFLPEESDDDSKLDVISFFDTVTGTVEPELLEAKETSPVKHYTNSSSTLV